MKTLTNIILGSVLALGLSGCNMKIEHTPVQQERTVVVNKEHRDAYKSTMWTGKTYMITHHDETNYVKFGGNTSFNVDNKNLYNVLEKGDSAIVLYKDKYLVRYDSKDTSKLNPVSKTLLERHFVDAVAIGNNTQVYY